MYVGDRLTRRVHSTLVGERTQTFAYRARDHVEAITVERDAQFGATRPPVALGTIHLRKTGPDTSFEEIDRGSNGTIEVTTEVTHDASGRVTSRKTVWADDPGNPSVTTFSYCP